jgi:hypothetical protein
MSKDQQVSFALKKINIDQFAILSNDVPENATIKLNARVVFGINRSNKMVACSADFEYHFEDKPFLKLKITCEFKVEEESWDKYCDGKQKKIVFPDGFMKHLAVITIGTTRGILHAKTEGKPLNKFILPAINVNDLVKEQIDFPLKGDGSNN